MSGQYGKSNKTTKFKAIGLSKIGASKYMFNMRDRETGTENEISVATYFTKHLGIKLQFPHLQCVEVRSRYPCCSSTPLGTCRLCRRPGQLVTAACRARGAERARSARTLPSPWSSSTSSAARSAAVS